MGGIRGALGVHGWGMGGAMRVHGWVHGVWGMGGQACTRVHAYARLPYYNPRLKTEDGYEVIGQTSPFAIIALSGQTSA